MGAYRALFPQSVPLDYIHIRELSPEMLRQYKHVILNSLVMLPEARASRSNRSLKRDPENLIATVRLSRVSRALYTVPMPPAPVNSRIRYGSKDAQSIQAARVRGRPGTILRPGAGILRPYVGGLNYIIGGAAQVSGSAEKPSSSRRGFHREVWAAAQ